MIHEEAPAVVEEVPVLVDEEGDVEDVYGDAPPVDEYRLSSRPRIVGGGS
ncbi:hypothetical protein [Streptomyces sp. NPDC001652]